MYREEPTWLVPQVGTGDVRMMQKSVDNVISDWGGIPEGQLCVNLAEESDTLGHVINKVYHDIGRM